jgi:hypothetical protein
VWVIIWCFWIFWESWLYKNWIFNYLFSWLFIRTRHLNVCDDSDNLHWYLMVYDTVFNTHPTLENTNWWFFVQGHMNMFRAILWGSQ